MRLDSLKKELKELGYNVKKVKFGLEVFYPLENSRFYIVERGEFMQISLKLLKASAFEKLQYKEELLEFILRLQYRPLGCRIAQSLGDLCIVSDIYQEQQDSDHIDNVVSKLHIFVFTFLEVIKKVGKTGKIPSVTEIDKLIKECSSEVNVVDEDDFDEVIEDDLINFDEDDYDDVDDFNEEDEDDFKYDEEDDFDF